jgi:hypothetical protein
MLLPYPIPIQAHAGHHCFSSLPQIGCACMYSKESDVPLAGALAVGARARVPDGFVRHDVWLSEFALGRSLLQGALGAVFEVDKKRCLQGRSTYWLGVVGLRRGCRSRRSRIWRLRAIFVAHTGLGGGVKRARALSRSGSPHRSSRSPPTEPIINHRCDHHYEAVWTYRLAIVESDF